MKNRMNLPIVLRSVGEKVFPAFVFIVIFLSGLSSSKASENYLVPDFAFPRTVEKNSRESLQKAINSGNQQDILRYAMNLIISGNMISEDDDVSSNISLLDSVENHLTGYYKNLCYLLEASVLSDAYNMQPGIYDTRILPLDGPYPDNTEEWSGSMFKERILQLIDKSSEDLKNLPTVNIREISLLTDLSKVSSESELTIPQFIALKGDEILCSFLNVSQSSVIPFYPQRVEESLEGRCRTKVNDLLDETINELSHGNSIVQAYAYLTGYRQSPDFQRKQYLSEAYDKLKESEGAGMILYELWMSDGKEPGLYYDKIKEWLDRYPKGFGKGQLEYALSDIEQKKIEIELPRLVLPKKPIEGLVTANNVSKGFILLYKLDEGEFDRYDNIILKKFKSAKTPVQKIEIGGEGEIPFGYSKQVEFKGLDAGLYVVIPSLTEKLPAQWNSNNTNFNYITLRATDIRVITTNNSNEKDSGKAYVVRGTDQQPIKGATVKYYRGYSGEVAKTLITNEEGWVTIPSGYYQIEAQYGKSKAKTEAGISYYEEKDFINYRASVFTDLAIYRPGDTVKFAVVGWTQEKYQNKLVKDKKVEIALYDANYQKADSLILELNKTGRAIGEMRIPSGRLLGNYHLNVSYPDFPGSGGGSTDFAVEEYKTPAFLVTIRQEESQEEGNISFTGQANTFAGMPIADATVEITLKYVPWRWGYFGNNAEYVERLRTDKNGDFTVCLPISNLKGTVYETGRYTIKACVTSISGETENSNTLVFSLGKGYDIRPYLPHKIEIKDDSVDLNVPVYDIAGIPVKTLLEYRIKNQYSNGNVTEGTFMSPELLLPCDSLTPGKYLFEFKIPRTEEWTGTESILWKATDDRAPYPSVLWVPKEEYVYEPTEESVEVVFGSYWPEWILMNVSDGEKTLETRWIEPIHSATSEAEPPSLHKLVIDTRGNRTLFVSLCGMHDLKSATAQIKLIPKKDTEKMEIETLSFRDNLVAGNSEEWTFRFKIGPTPASFVNALGVMTDKALNSLRDFKWNMNIWEPAIYNKYQITSRNIGNSVAYRSFTKIVPYVREKSLVPQWNTYGYPFVSGGMFNRMAGGVRLYKAMASRNAITESAQAAIKEEEAEDSAVEASAEGGEEKDEIRFRPVEMPVAFFYPELKSDDRGNLDVKFTVPDFNTTWQFQLVGYDDAMKNANLILDAVASKPVMVKTNLPQFLRTGDQATVSATFYNNSGNPLDLEGKMQVIEPVSGKVLTSRKFDAETVDPSGNRIVSVSFEVPADVTSLTVKTYATGANHTDGEQGLIKVLPSSTPVTEAKTFYAGSVQDIIELNLPKIRKNANITLKYCDNPLWEVLLSLPAITEGCNSSALSISQWLFGTVTAADIIWNNDEISSGLKKILESQDSTLSMSNLSIDAELKVTDIEATPWINKAANETFRIRSLKKYFDRDNVNQQINVKTKALENLQLPDGGWSWFEGMKSSPYITSGVLFKLGYLNDRGLLSGELKQMAKRGTKYYDKWLADQYEENKKISVTNTVNYLYTLDMLDIPASGKMKKIKAETFDSICSQWRHWDVKMKAIGAMVLMSEAKYRPTAMEMIESLKQFINSRMNIEEEALLVELFNKTEGNEDVIEKVIQNMFLQKETQDWGYESHTAAVVHVLSGLSAGENVNRKLPEVFIGSKRIILPETQALTGNFTVNLTAEDITGKKLVIKREAGIPAWGGVISQYVAPIKEVKKSDVENLSIEKRIFREDTDGELKQVTSFSKGDKVTVVLNLNVGKDMDYVVVVDSRAACLKPDDQTSNLVVKDGMVMYREIRASKTSFFIENLPAGKYVLSYDCHADREGEYATGIAEVQCLYSPAQIAHSGGSEIFISNNNF